MTIASETVASSGSTGNGVTTQFSFSFNLDPDGYGATTAASQVQVIKQTISSGVETILTLTTDYTVSVNADQSSSPGGSVTLTSAPSSSYKIWIRLNPDFTQQTDYQNQGGFLMETVEDQADQQGRQILVLKDMLRRVPMVSTPAGASFDGKITGPFSAGYAIVVNGTSTGFILGSTPTNAISSAATTALQQTSLPTIQVALGLKERLTAIRNYYVRTDGSDSNTGLANTAGGAFLTIQKAVDVIMNSIDNGGYDIAINVAAGTYTGGVIVNGGWTGDGDVYLVLPSSAIISTTSADAVLVQYGARLKVVATGGGKVQTTTSGNGYSASLGAVLEVTDPSLGACATSKWSAGNGGQILIYGTGADTGNAVSCMHADGGGLIRFAAGATYTYSSTPTFSSYNAGVSNGGCVDVRSVTYSGAVTGKRFLAHHHGVINADGQTRTFIPGNSAGTTDHLGTYVGSDNEIYDFESEWQSSTPTITAGTGTFTSVACAAKYKFNGAICHYHATITVTTVGTASASIVLPLPTATVNTLTAHGLNGTTHTGVHGLAAAAASSISLYCDTAFPANGEVIHVDMTYEIAPT